MQHWSSTVAHLWDGRQCRVYGRLALFCTSRGSGSLPAARFTRNAFCVLFLNPPAEDDPPGLLLPVLDVASLQAGKQQLLSEQ